MSQDQLRYSKTHEWVAVEGDTATIGITDFAVHLLSDLVFADLPKPGKALTQGQPFGEVESVKAVSDLYAPVSGEVLERNEVEPRSVEDELDTEENAHGVSSRHDRENAKREERRGDDEVVRKAHVDHAEHRAEV